MKQVYVSSDNLASLFLGKNINTGWRYQRDLTLVVEYKEWLEFMKKYSRLRISLPVTNNNFSKQLFYLDVAWSLFNEVNSAINTEQDATLIVPSIEDGKEVSLVDAMQEFSIMAPEVVNGSIKKLKLLNDDYYTLNNYGNPISIDYSYKNTSDWNDVLYKLSVFILNQKSNIKFVWR